MLRDYEYVNVDQLSPPSGTVTFLFTDIEGSTRLWEQHPAEMQGALERHDEIVREAIGSQDGYVFSTAGDSFGAAFERAGSAVAAAVEAQRLLSAENWPSGVSVRARMGAHTGEAQERGGDYFGPAVNRAARLMSAAHGGQTVVSSATRELLSDAEPMVALGVHRLKDLGAPQLMWQLGTDTFPPLRTLERARHNLPVQRTELFGREDEIVELTSLLRGERLVTLTGVGGAGKTRLALAVAAELIDDFGEGVFFVSLAAVSDPGSVGSVVAEAAGYTASSTDIDSVAAFLGTRDLLMVIDNCEHLVDDVADLVDATLGSGSAGRVLATSREALEVDGERTFTVPSLRADNVDSAGVRLLVDRATAVRSDLVIDDAAMASMLEVCAPRRHSSGLRVGCGAARSPFARRAR